MDKLVRRVTVVQSSGDHREAKVVYENDEDEDADDEGPGTPNFKRLERSVRHMLKAQVIAAQDAYQRHLDSVAKGGNSWMIDDPGNFMKARKKELKEIPVAELGVDTTPRVKTIKLEAPPKRQAGRKVESVQELIRVLHDEAKVI
jgi:hypothetical protein